MRYIRALSSKERESLEYGYQYGTKHYFRIKCKSILLSDNGKTITEISDFSGKTPRTIRNWFDSFEENGIEKLVIKEGRGIKAPLDNLTENQIIFVKKEIKKNYQNLNSVCAILSSKFNFEVTKWMLKRFIKKNLITVGIGLGKT